MTLINDELQVKYTTLTSLLAQYARIAVAFSGGVDSTLLLKVAHDVLGSGVTAFFADSVVQVRGERASAIALARGLSADLVVLPFDLLNFDEFTRNPVDRCYLCKTKIFSEIRYCSTKRGIEIMVDGTNLDDLSQFRPGAKAVSELGVKAPLVEAKLTKKDIRQLSKHLGLSTWDKHSSSCLATRIATGQTITAERLALVSTAESYLKDHGFLGCRVRLDGTACVVELAVGDMARFAGQRLAGEFAVLMKNHGMSKVFLDLQERAGINMV